MCRPSLIVLGLCCAFASSSRADCVRAHTGGALWYAELVMAEYIALILKQHLHYGSEVFVCVCNIDAPSPFILTREGMLF